MLIPFYNWLRLADFFGKDKISQIKIDNTACTVILFGFERNKLKSNNLRFLI